MVGVSKKVSGLRHCFKPFTSELLRKVADLFLFQCYTGFAYQDVRSFHPDEHLKLNPGGRAWVYKPRVKTAETAVLPYPFGRAALKKG